MQYLGYDLIRAFNGGNSEAFSLLFKTLYGDLFYFTKRYVDDDQAAEDIVSETFTKLWGRRGHFIDEQKLQGFLFTTAKNACLNHLRRSKKESDIHQGYQYLSSDNIEPFPADQITAQVITALYEEMENLPDKCREVAKMLFFERLSVSKVAWELGISEKTVRAQKDRAKKLLRAAIYKRGIFIVLPFLFIFYKD